MSCFFEIIEIFMEETLMEGLTTLVVLIIRKVLLPLGEVLIVSLSTQCQLDRMGQILGEEK